MTQQDQSASTPETPHATLRREVERVIEKIRPGVQLDGGDIELANVSPDGAVHIRFLGACVGCPSAPMTLQHGIERSLKSEVPRVTSVHAVE